MTPRLPPLAEILDLVPDAVCVVAPDGRFLFVNASFQRIFGYTPEEALAFRAFDLVHPDDREATQLQAQRVMAGQLQRHYRNRYIHKDGHVVDVQWSARWLPDHGVRIAVGHEVGELRRVERELEFLATHDPLTGLPNRHHLQQALQSAIAHATRTGDGLALLYLDLDGFKAANDRGGHEAGDRLLREVAQRLRETLREQDFVARLGGDEFVVLLPGCRDRAGARTIADTLHARLRVPYPMRDGTMQLGVSVGIACFPEDGSDPEALLARADSAMYAAKRGR